MTEKIVIGGSSVSAAQLEKLFIQIANKELNGDHIQAVIEHRDPFMEVGTEGFFNLHVWVGGKGLYFHASFVARVLLTQNESVPYRGLDDLTSYTLPSNMSDWEVIDNVLGGMDEALKYPITFDQPAALIGLQPNGEDGQLLNNGYANVFHGAIDGKLFMFFITSDSGFQGWRVKDWQPSEKSRWSAGDKIFFNKRP